MEKERLITISKYDDFHEKFWFFNTLMQMFFKKFLKTKKAASFQRQPIYRYATLESIGDLLIGLQLPLVCLYFVK